MQAGTAFFRLICAGRYADALYLAPALKTSIIQRLSDYRCSAKHTLNFIFVNTK